LKFKQTLHHSTINFNVILPLQFSPTWLRHQEANKGEHLILSAKVETTVFTTGITEIIQGAHEM
jgi:hypothetical protein